MSDPTLCVVKFKRLDIELLALTQAYVGDACFDLYNRHRVVIAPYSTYHIDFGIALQIPPFYEAQIRSRSGWSRKGIHIIHGTIDSNYRGEVGAAVFNASGIMQEIERGAKIAQLAIRPIPDVRFTEVQILDPTVRGKKGFGSSGM